MKTFTWIPALLLFVSLCTLVARADQPVELFNFRDASQWTEDGVSASFSPDNIVTLTGSGNLKLNADILTTANVTGYTRLVVDYYIEGGPASDLGMASKGFPQTSGFTYPRWAPLDASTPTNRWITYSYQLDLCEWNGGSAAMLPPGEAGLTFINTPGGATTAVKMRNPRFVADPVTIDYDWMKPFAPLYYTPQPGGGATYSKTYTLRSNAATAITVQASILNAAGSQFAPVVTPSSVVVPAGGTATITVTGTAAPGLPELYTENLLIQFLANTPGQEPLIRELRLAAPVTLPTAPVVETPANPSSNAINTAMNFELRMPPGPCIWMSQSNLNKYAVMTYTGYDTFRDANGVIYTGTALTSGAMHRLIITHITNLAAAYANTGNVQYAERVRDWLLLYAAEANDYPLKLPISEATSLLCPDNCTYVQCSVVMNPLMRAYNLVAYAPVFSQAQRDAITYDFIIPRMLESQKINAGMTNMQDEYNLFVFRAGINTGNPNLIAEGIFGSHGVQVKIDVSYTPDGNSEESIAPNYHTASLDPVVALVNEVLGAGIETGMDTSSLDNAQTLMSKVAMPNGQTANRGDSPFPTGSYSGANTLGSMTFDHFGMTFLREGTGSDMIYVGLDHRPPATSHSHHDKLGIVLYGGGKIFGVDEGSLYNGDAGTSLNVPNRAKREAWITHSLVHNTITVDKTDQKFGGGHRLYYQNDAGVKAVGAYTDNVYDDVRFERHMALSQGALVIVDRLSSSTQRTFDLAHHSFGTLASSLTLDSVASLDTATMYDKPEQARHATLAAGNRATFTWTQAPGVMHYQVVNAESTATDLYTAVGWANVAYRNFRQEAPMLMARKTGTSAVFISVIDFAAQPVAVGTVQNSADLLTLEVGDSLFAFRFAQNDVRVTPIGAVDELTGVSLAVDPASPQQAGTPIQLTATAEGGADVRYKFMAGATEIRGYDASATCTWTPAQAGAYQLTVVAKDLDGLNPNLEVTSTAVPYSVTPLQVSLSGVALTADPPSPQLPNRALTLTATPVDGINVEYRFFKVFNGVTTTLQPYGASNTCPVTPATVGQYQFIVWAREVGSATKYASSLVYKINQPLSGVALASSPKWPQAPGTPITLTATPTNGGQVEYRFYVATPGGPLTVYRQYGTANTCQYTPEMSGIYQFLVYAREVGSGVTKQAHATITFNVATPITGVTLQAFPPAPQPPSTPLTLTAQVTGGFKVQYRFFVAPPGGAFTTLQHYTVGANSIEYTPTAPGLYTFLVWVRETGSTKPTKDAYGVLTYRVP